MTDSLEDQEQTGSHGEVCQGDSFSDQPGPTSQVSVQDSQDLEKVLLASLLMIGRQSIHMMDRERIARYLSRRPLEEPHDRVDPVTGSRSHFRVGQAQVSHYLREEE